MKFFYLLFFIIFFSCSEKKDTLAEMRFIHDGAGPFVAAGVRIGEKSLAEFAVAKNPFDLMVDHVSYKDVQYSCVMDGYISSLGVSPGKLNLVYHSSDSINVETTIKHIPTNRILVFRLRDSFYKKYLNCKDENLEIFAQEVLDLPFDSIATFKRK
jgi:hypothetical protein